MTEKTQPKKRGRPPFQPTEEERQQVTRMAVAGITHEQIALCVRNGIDADTLKKHFKQELATSKIKAIANLAGNLYQRAMAGDTTSSIFYLKTQGGWKETTRNEVTGADGGPVVLWGGKPDD
jgi:hypothetical protein